MARVVGVIRKAQCRGETHRIRELDGGAITPLDCTWAQVHAEWLAASMGGSSPGGCAWAVRRLIKYRRSRRVYDVNPFNLYDWPSLSDGERLECFAECSRQQRVKCRAIARVREVLEELHVLLEHVKCQWRYDLVSHCLAEHGSSLVEYRRLLMIRPGGCIWNGQRWEPVFDRVALHREIKASPEEIEAALSRNAREVFARDIVEYSVNLTQQRATCRAFKSSGIVMLKAAPPRQVRWWSVKQASDAVRHALYGTVDVALTEGRGVVWLRDERCTPWPEHTFGDEVASWINDGPNNRHHEYREALAEAARRVFDALGMAPVVQSPKARRGVR